MENTFLLRGSILHHSLLRGLLTPSVSMHSVDRD